MEKSEFCRTHCYMYSCSCMVYMYVYTKLYMYRICILYTLCANVYVKHFIICICYIVIQSVMNLKHLNVKLLQILWICKLFAHHIPSIHVYVLVSILFKLKMSNVCR